MKKIYHLKFSLLMLLMAASFAGHKANAQMIYGTSPFQDSLWSVDTTSWTVVNRFGPTLAGFTITGMNGLAYDPVGHETYIIMKVSGVTGRVLGKIDLTTGVCTQVGNLGANFSSIAFDANGQLFGMTGDGATPPETLFKINKSNGVTTMQVALGNGADGEIIAYNKDDNQFYHWSGNGTVVYEKFPVTAPYTPITNIPTSGPASGETFGALYLGNNNFIVSNISSQFKYVTTSGVYSNPLPISLPDDLRGLVMPPSFTFMNDTVCVGEDVAWTMGNAGFAMDTVVYHWGDGTSSTVFPAAGATHSYATAGNYTVHAVLKNDTVGLDTMKFAPLRVNAVPAVNLNPNSDTTLCLVDSLHLLGASGGALQWYMNGVAIPGATTSSYDVTLNGWYNQEKVNLNGCRDSAATGILVQFGDQPTADLGADSTICDGDTLCVGLNNPTGVTYLWSTGSTLNGECFTSPGTYSVSATDSVGCEAVDSILVNVILAPDINVSIDTSNCPTLVFNSNDPNGTSWNWSFGDGGTATGNPATHTYTANGSYTGIVTATNQCFTVSDSGTIDITCLVGLESALGNNISVAPNPSNGSFLLNVTLPTATTLSYKVTDLSGRSLLDWSSEDVRTTWSERIAVQAAPGIYFLSVMSGNDRAVYPIVIQ